MENSLQPEYFDHPIFNPLWMKFRTPHVELLDNKIRQWLYCGITGAIILGESRTGKTTAIEMLNRNYVTRGKGQPIYSHLFSVPKRDKMTIASLVRELCISTKNEIKNYSSTDKLSKQILEFFIDKACINDMHIVMLFVDECQLLNMSQMEVFAELHNSLRTEGITLFAFFIGNKSQSEELVLLSKDRKFDYISGRFFTQIHEFKGISSKSELEKVLEAYDTYRYPEAVGPTYTEYFVPKEYSNGWRLKNESGLIWSVLSKHGKFLNLKSWGMKYLIGTINPLLTDYLHNYSVSRINENMIERCIDASGINNRFDFDEDE